jgi:dTDP-4-amino-4,6-dideoxygalactose transaminase
MTSVPMFNLSNVTDVEKLTEIASSVLNSSQHILGQNVTDFERVFGNYIGVKECIGVANGSDALVIALRALGVNRNDEVATVANAGFYTCAALNQIGAQPIFIDIDLDSQLIDPKDFKSKVLTNKIKFLVVTHLYGQVAPIKELLDICIENGIRVLEDCAQAHGAQVDGKKVGSFGDISTFSFYPTKNLGAVGDGGAVLTNNIELAEKVRKIRQYGWGKKYEVEIENGVNSRLDELQAAFLLEKLENLDTWNKQRISIAEQYTKAFTGAKVKVLSNTLEGVAHLFVVLSDNRKELIDHLAKHKIQSAIHYPIADHKQKIYENRFKDIKLPITEDSVGKILSLPIYPGMKQEDINHIISAVTSF